MQLQFDNWLLDAWAKSEQEGTPVYQLVTANKLQTGKTTYALREAESVEELIHGRKYSIDNLEFEIKPFLARKLAAPPWTPCILDEPNRPASNRAWWVAEVALLNEDLQTSAFEHKPVILPLPHEHLIDFSAASVCTSHAIIDRKGHATVYELQRDQLNRQFKTRTYKVGEVNFGRPSPKLWHDYLEKREAYRATRREFIANKLTELAQNANRTVTITDEEILETVLGDPLTYGFVQGGKERISPTKLRTQFAEKYHEDLSWARCQKLAPIATSRLMKKAQDTPA